MEPEGTMGGDGSAHEPPGEIRPRVKASRIGGSGSDWPSTGRGSVTGALVDLQASDPQVRNEAAQRLWDRFAPRLRALARRRLNPRIRVREDESDIVQSLFRSFLAAQQGDGDTPGGREQLWRLLVRMTLCKVANAANHHQRARRDVRRERRPVSWSGPPGEGEDLPIELHRFQGPSAEEEAISRIELARLLGLLREDLREILVWRLEGYTNAEIGRKLYRTERTVELKMRLIRETLGRDPGVSPEVSKRPDDSR
jgi:DNA-directed RNA polymerase specialized sigma24 family protein